MRRLAVANGMYIYYAETGPHHVTGPLVLLR
jgi:hypothetical protein